MEDRYNVLFVMAHFGTKDDDDGGQQHHKHLLAHFVPFRNKGCLSWVKQQVSVRKSEDMSPLSSVERLETGPVHEDDKARVVQTLLFVGGINTLLQTLFGTRLPTVISGSYASVVPIISIIHDPSLQNIENDHQRFLQTMRAIQGALIVSSSIQIILGYSQLWGICSRFFSPLGMVPVVALVGFGLFDKGFPVVGRCVEIGVPMLILFVVFSQYLKHIHVRNVPILERFSLLVTIVIVWVYAHLLTVGGAYKHRPELTQINCRTDRSHLISSAPWIMFPYPLQWGAPTFNAGHSFGMMEAIFVSLVESTAAYKAAARLSSATPPPAQVDDFISQDLELTMNSGVD